jgi:hypothetical protein
MSDPFSSPPGHRVDGSAQFAFRALRDLVVNFYFFRREFVAAAMIGWRSFDGAMS